MLKPRKIGEHFTNGETAYRAYLVSVTKITSINLISLRFCRIAQADGSSCSSVGVLFYFPTWGPFRQSISERSQHDEPHFHNKRKHKLGKKHKQNKVVASIQLIYAPKVRCLAAIVIKWFLINDGTVEQQDTFNSSVRWRSSSMYISYIS